MVFFLQFEHVRSYHDPRAQDSARGSGGGFAPDVKLLTALCGALERASAWQQALGWGLQMDLPPFSPPTKWLSIRAEMCLQTHIHPKWIPKLKILKWIGM